MHRNGSARARYHFGLFVPRDRGGNCRRIGGSGGMQPRCSRPPERPRPSRCNWSGRCASVVSLRSGWLYLTLPGAVTIAFGRAIGGGNGAVTVASAGRLPWAGAGRIRAGAEIGLRHDQGALCDVPRPPGMLGLRLGGRLADRTVGRHHGCRTARDPPTPGGLGPLLHRRARRIGRPRPDPCRVGTDFVFDPSRSCIRHPGMPDVPLGSHHGTVRMPCPSEPV